jgi:hypothetical protein
MKNVNVDELRKNKVTDFLIDMILTGATDAEIMDTVNYILEDLNKKYQRHNDKEAYRSFCLYKVGDQIEVDLNGFGVFTATVQKIKDDSIIFMFDDCISEMPMNHKCSNEGGYDRSGLCYWINTVLKNAFPEEIRQHITDISLPTYGQIFGHDEFYHEYFETDKDEQFELMKKRKNRIADYENKPEWFWLQNSTKKEVSASDFASVGTAGGAACTYASNPFGVRPVFTLSV